MKSKESRPEGFRTTLMLALPLGLASAGEQLLGLVDTLIAGQLGAAQLAATGLGNALFMSALIMGIGLLSGIETLTAQARGRQETQAIARILRSRRLLSLILSIPVIALSEIFLRTYFAIGDIDIILQQEMSVYLAARYLSVPFVLHSTVSRALLQAFEDPKAVLRSMIWVNIINLPLNIVFATDLHTSVFGIELRTFGWGVVGLGLSTSVVSCFRAIYLKQQFSHHMKPSAQSMTRTDLEKLCLIGIPIGLHWLSEMSLFSVVGLMAGLIGVHQAAAHQIALTLASLSFTLCLGLSIAGTVRVGLAVGEKDAHRARREGNRGVFCALLLMGVSGICFFVFNRQLVSLFSSDPLVLSVAEELLKIAAAFQLVDGVQAVMAGNLRGLGATRWAFISALIGFWLIGFPTAYYFSLTDGTHGLWWGLVTGLAVSAALQALGFYRNLTASRFQTFVKLLD
ncbi:MAG: MATE family efflux transporter [Bradymonadia bacterium]